MSLVNQGGKLLLTNGVLASGAECCCAKPCDCGSCSLTLTVNGTVVPIGNGLGAHSCDAPCEPTCEDFLRETIGTGLPSEGCAPTNQNPCPEFLDFTGQPMVTSGVSCGSFASACLHCSEDGLCVRVFYYAVTVYSCNNGQAFDYHYRARYADYTLDLLPPCDQSAVLEKIDSGDYQPLLDVNLACAGPVAADAGPCGGCEDDSVVQISCNPFI